jgi:hypothetical protein
MQEESTDRTVADKSLRLSSHVGLAEPGSYYQYAKGKIVIWVPKESKLDLGSGLKALLDPSIKKIAVANPTTRPVWTSSRRGDAERGRLRQSEGQARSRRKHLTNRVVCCIGIGPM